LWGAVLPAAPHIFFPAHARALREEHVQRNGNASGKARNGGRRRVSRGCGSPTARNMPPINAFRLFRTARSHSVERLRLSQMRAFRLQSPQAARATQFIDQKRSLFGCDSNRV
jgi:hypothetical protein